MTGGNICEVPKRVVVRAYLMQIRIQEDEMASELNRLTKEDYFKGQRPHLCGLLVLPLVFPYLGQEKRSLTLSSPRLGDEGGVQNDIASAEFHGMAARQQTVILFHGQLISIVQLI